MHPSELARLQQDLAYDPNRLAPVVEPGSLAEEDALAEIDNARRDEIAKLGDTFQARQQRAMRAHARRGI